jgi:hypothetical protein
MTPRRALRFGTRHIPGVPKIMIPAPDICTLLIYYVFLKTKKYEKCEKLYEHCIDDEIVSKMAH